MTSAPTRGLATLILLLAASSAPADPPKDTPAPPAERAPAKDPATEPGPLAPADYPATASVHPRLVELAKRAGARGSVVQVATSRGGQPVHALVLGDQDMTRRRPAMLLVAGLDGSNLASTEQLLAALDAALRDDPKLLDLSLIHI